MLKPKADEPVVAREFAVVRAAIGVPEADRVATTLDPVIEGYLSEASKQTQRA
jgi:hypothetical protein